MIIDPSDPTTLTSPALAADEAAIDASLAAAGTTLAQAQTVKSAFVDGIFNALRQQPITVAVSAGSYSFDGGDEAIAALSAAALSALLTGSVAALAVVVGALNTDIDGTAAALQANITANTAAIAANTAAIAANAAAIAALSTRVAANTAAIVTLQSGSTD